MRRDLQQNEALAMRATNPAPKLKEDIVENLIQYLGHQDTCSKPPECKLNNLLLEYFLQAELGKFSAESASKLLINEAQI
jgi:hypothetical protein